MNLGSFPLTTTKNAQKAANRKCAVGLISGVAVGAAIGAAMGLLFAPQSGAETRKLVKDKSCEIAGTVKDKAVQVVDVVKTKINELKDGKCCCDDDCCCDDTTETEA